MEPIGFPEANSLLTASAEDIGPLPVYRGEGQIVSCWRGSWRERLRFLWTGRLWLHVLAPVTQPPVALAIGPRPFRARAVERAALPG